MHGLAMAKNTAQRAKRKDEKPSHQDEFRIAISRRRGHREVPKIGIETELPDRADAKGEDPNRGNTPWREPRGEMRRAEMQKKRQNRGGSRDFELGFERPAEHQKRQHDARAGAFPPQIHRANSESHRTRDGHQPGHAPGLRLNDQKRGTPIAKHRGHRNAAQTGHEHRGKDRPAASLLSMRGNHEGCCLNDQRRKTLHGPKARKQKWASQFMQALQRGIDRD